MAKITISVDANGRVVCSPEGGNIRKSHNAEEKIEWVSDYKFSLSFARITGEGVQSWPFEKASAPPPVSETVQFEGTLALQNTSNPPVYKYTVAIDGYVPDDPIIIVDE